MVSRGISNKGIGCLLPEIQYERDYNDEAPLIERGFAVARAQSGSGEKCGYYPAAKTIQIFYHRGAEKFDWGGRL
jgi:hypothetical protein